MFPNQSSVCASLLLLLLASLGCGSSETIETAVPEQNGMTAGSSSDGQPGGSDPGKTSDDPFRISGDLGSVDWESMIGKKVVIEGDLVVVDTYDLLRRGQIKVARERLFIPTSSIDPNDSNPDDNSFEGGSNVAKVNEAQKANNQATIILDDGTAEENVFPPALFPELGKSLPTVRIGSVVNGVSGQLVKAGNATLLIADRPLEWTPAQRPQRPDVGDADATVASFNVLNYFTTIDDGQNNARGADSASEFSRQEKKLVSAILSLEADVIGLMELENNLEAEERLVAALNREIGAETFRGCGLPEGFNSAPGGTNAIRVGFIYRSDRVKPVGGVAMVQDEAFLNARTPLVQQFKSLTGTKPFTVIVNHFKSKGGSSRADADNKDKGDGQGGYNAARRSQSLAICNYIKQQSLDQTDRRVLVIGDLNAYAQEDPIDALRANGLVDLKERFASQTPESTNRSAYSFIYYGQSGSLDHVLATPPMAEDITGVATWHLNSDEPRFLDYNQEFNPASLYQVDPFRSSDHDPILIGIGN